MFAPIAKRVFQLPEAEDFKILETETNRRLDEFNEK